MNDPSRINPDPAIDAATGDGKPIDAWPALPEELAAAALHRAAAQPEQLPEHVADSIEEKLSGLIDEQRMLERATAAAPLAFEAPRAARPIVPWLLAAAASLLLVASISFYAVRLAESRRELAAAAEHAQALELRISQNETVLADAKQRIDTLGAELATKTGEVRDRDSKLVDAATRNRQLALELSDAAAKFAQQQGALTEAQLRIARLEAPSDPEIARQNRQKLLEVPDTVRIAWAPFNLEGAPVPEQPNIQGDVIWNDRLESGYLRFVGLKQNDPKLEQYQVWVIDERGLEQKVSGGVFNANADGEVIVPIKPGIEVGRVALFAITVEKPGGTWVPDLKRRLVVAPRS